MDEKSWISAGLVLLAESGVDAVRVERLSDRMATSKVSFYWHFKDRPDFLAAMLKAWRAQTSLNMPERAEPPAWDRLRRLIDLPTLGDSAAFGASVEIAIRHWARADGLAREAVRETDRQRLAYIAKAVRAGGVVSDSECEARAFLIYAYIQAEAFGGMPLPQASRVACDAILGRATSFVDPARGA